MTSGYQERSLRGRGPPRAGRAAKPMCVSGGVIQILGPDQTKGIDG
ncbi:hypothetical protein [Sorangium sp. So ce406]